MDEKRARYVKWLGIYWLLMVLINLVVLVGQVSSPDPDWLAMLAPAGLVLFGVWVIQTDWR